jgi:hypothetical protein
LLAADPGKNHFTLQLRLTLAAGPGGENSKDHFETKCSRIQSILINIIVRFPAIVSLFQ